jgi:hypothetical protein
VPETVLLSELVPVLAVTGPFAFALAIVRSLPHAARGIVVLAAGITAIITRDDARRESCHKVLDMVTRRDGGPPFWPRRRAITRR